MLFSLIAGQAAVCVAAAQRGAKPKRRPNTEAVAVVAPTPTPEAPTNTTVADIKFVMVNPLGEVSAAYPMSGLKTAPIDLLFRASIPETYKEYSSYVFEVSDPIHNLNYQIELDGKVPAIIHWDGWFTSTERLRPNQQYFVRIALVWPNGNVVTSLWTPFNTKLEGREKGIKSFQPNSLSLYIIPSGSLSVVQARTTSATSGYLPILAGDLKLVIKDVHTAGLRLEASNTLFFNFRTPELGLYFSDVSVFYRYRFTGAPPRYPNLPFVPAYAKDIEKESSPSKRLYGKLMNVELGARFFSTTIRGISGTVIDGQYARAMMGMTGTLYIDRQFWPFRLYAAGEAGYTLFKGQMLTFSGEAGIGLDSIPAVIPNVFFKYQLFSGVTSPDGAGLTTTVRNTLMYAGLSLIFRI